VETEISKVRYAFDSPKTTASLWLEI